MNAAILRIEKVDGALTAVAGLTIRFDKSTWEASSDPKGLFSRANGSIDTTIANLIALKSSGVNIAQLQGLNPNTARLGDEGDGLIFTSSGLKHTIAWRVEQIF